MKPCRQTFPPILTGVLLIIGGLLLRVLTQWGLDQELELVELLRVPLCATSFGLLVGDSLLLTVSRRLSRYLSPTDPHFLALLWKSLKPPASAPQATEPEPAR